MADSSAEQLGSATRPDADIASLGTRPPEAPPSPTSENDDSYIYDPASSPRANRIGRQVGIGVFCFFMALCTVIVVWWLLQRITQWRRQRNDKRIKRIKGDARRRDIDSSDNDDVEGGDVEKGIGIKSVAQDSLTCSPASSMSSSTKSSPFSIPTPDHNAYRHDPYSPAAAAAANRMRRQHGNFSRPNMLKLGPSGGKRGEQQPVLPALELGDYRLSHGHAKGGAEIGLRSERDGTFDNLAQHAGYPYGNGKGGVMV